MLSGALPLSPVSQQYRAARQVRQQYRAQQAGLGQKPQVPQGQSSPTARLACQESHQAPAQAAVSFRQSLIRDGAMAKRGDVP